MLADILNIKINTINTAEGGALGAVILAMVGCGKYRDVSTACKRIISNAKTFIPNLNRHKHFLNKFKN
jgi:xylulokinase